MCFLHTEVHEIEIALWRDISIYEFSRASSEKICISHNRLVHNCSAAGKAINVLLRIICSFWPKIWIFSIFASLNSMARRQRKDSDGDIKAYSKFILHEFPVEGIENKWMCFGWEGFQLKKGDDGVRGINEFTVFDWFVAVLGIDIKLGFWRFLFEAFESFLSFRFFWSFKVIFSFWAF
jgi:hypothetical protein